LRDSCHESETEKSLLIGQEKRVIILVEVILTR